MEDKKENNLEEMEEKIIDDIEEKTDITIKERMKDKREEEVVEEKPIELFYDTFATDNNFLKSILDKEGFVKSPDIIRIESLPNSIRNRFTEKQFEYFRKRFNNEIKEISDKEEKEKILFSGFGKLTDFLNIAEQFHKQQPFYYDKYKIWWLWNPLEYKWIMVDDVDLMNAIDGYNSNPNTNLTVKNEIVEALKRIGRKNKPLEAKETWIQFKDTIYDLKTKEMFKATPKYFITNPIPHKLGNETATPNLDRILKEWVLKDGVQSESYVKTLKEILAYTLLSYMPIHRIFCLIGIGLNGKGTFLRLNEKLAGSENCCATELEILSSVRFESSKLHKKLVCFVGEVDKGIFKKTKTLKSLTGEDKIRMEYKGKDCFDSKNYANPIIATNHLPETSDKTKGFYRRWTIVDFPNEFNEKKNILDEIPEIEYSNFCLQAIYILKDLLDRGEFINDGTIEEREDKYEKHSSFITEFIKSYCEPKNDEFIIFGDFCNKYNEYLLSEGLNKKTKFEISKSLGLRGYEKYIKKFSDGMYNTTKMCIKNLKWMGEIEELS